MKVALVFRSKERNEFSIEALFETLKKYLNNQVFETVDYYMPKGRYNRISCLFQNVRFARKINANIYHITGEVNFVAPIFPKESTIITVHDYVDLETMKGLKRWIRWLFWCYIPYRHSKYIACISNKTMEETISRFPFTSDKVIYVPNPIDDTFVRTTKEFNSTNPRILVVGTRANKNLERIIEAVKEIHCELFIIGVLAEKQRSLLENLKINYKNVFHISNDEVHQAYCNCDMLCFPSTYEGFGRPIIEANAIGRAVITSNLEPMVEVSNGAALLVDPYDVESVKSGIQTIINNKKYRETLIDRGYENAEKYKASKVANIYLQIYNSLITK